MRISLLLVSCVPLGLLACSAPSPDSVDEPAAVYGASRSALGGTLREKTTEILVRVGPFAEDSLYSCLLHGLMQGLPIGQAMEECEIKLLEDDATGFGSIDSLGMHDSAPFDPGTITSACSTGDPTLAQSSGVRTTKGWGEYSWGGDPAHYRGLTFEESRREKDIAIQEALELDLRFRELELSADIAKANLDAAKASGDSAAIAAAEKAYKEASKKAVDAAGKALDASEKARKDPNLKGPVFSSTVRGESPCSQTLAAARELLRECHRTGWKTYACQKLRAQMNGCPDPALILVDPEQGYSCGDKPDPEAVRAAAVAQCEERVKYGPGGDNPCEPLSIDKSGLYYRGPGGLCNNPQAYVDPGQASCTQSLRIPGDGRPDLNAIIVMGLDKFGGPIFVLPPPPPPFDPNTPQPEPRPGGRPFP
ncbi:MAG: hypothetical protein KIS78_01200 [Labilithrix sp.]|nr:hypothetical protein [Labilithrix sp.]